jgi:hypothetical protein
MCIYPDTLADYLPSVAIKTKTGWFRKRWDNEKPILKKFLHVQWWYTIIGFALPPVIDIYGLSATLVLYGLTPPLLLLKYFFFRRAIKDKQTV